MTQIYSAKILKELLMESLRSQKEISGSRMLNPLFLIIPNRKTVTHRNILWTTLLELPGSFRFSGLCVSLEKSNRQQHAVTHIKRHGEPLKRAPVSTIMDQAVSPVSSLAVLPTRTQPFTTRFHLYS